MEAPGYGLLLSTYSSGRHILVIIFVLLHTSVQLIFDVVVVVYSM